MLQDDTRSLQYQVTLAIFVHVATKLEQTESTICGIMIVLISVFFCHVIIFSFYCGVLVQQSRMTHICVKILLRE